MPVTSLFTSALKEACDARSLLGTIREDKSAEMETFRARFCSTTDTLRLNKWPIDLKEPVDLFKMVVKEPFRSF